MSFVFRLCLYLSLSLSCLHISNTHPISLPKLWIFSTFCTSNKNTFPNFIIFFFLSLVPIIAQPPVNRGQPVKHFKHYTNLYSLISTNSSLSLSLSLSHIKEKFTNTKWKRVTKPPKKKKKHDKHRFNSQSPIQFITHQ